MASVGNAVLHNPGEAIAFVGGAALAGVSSAGVAVGAGATATGAGAVVGVPLGGWSALGVATGLGIAGVAGASIINDAMGDDRVEPVQPDGRAVEPESGDAAVGSELRSVGDLMANPQLLKGRSPDDVEPVIGDTPGWQVEALGRGRSQGQGWVFRRYNDRGEPTGEQIRWHPGGGHHGPDPYWRVVGPNGDLGGVIR